MENRFFPEETAHQTAAHIGTALRFLTREAEAAGLPDLAAQIEAAETVAFEEIRHGAYLQV